MHGGPFGVLLLVLAAEVHAQINEYVAVNPKTTDPLIDYAPSVLHLASSPIGAQRRG
jgi:hypothetical protein